MHACITSSLQATHMTLHAAKRLPAADPGPCWHALNSGSHTESVKVGSPQQVCLSMLPCTFPGPLSSSIFRLKLCRHS